MVKFCQKWVKGLKFFKSEKVLLNIVRRMAVTMIFVSDRMVKISSPYLPLKSEKYVFYAASYVQNVNQGLSEVIKSLIGDIDH